MTNNFKRTLNCKIICFKTLYVWIITKSGTFYIIFRLKINVSSFLFIASRFVNFIFYPMFWFVCNYLQSVIQHKSSALARVFKTYGRTLITFLLNAWQHKLLNPLLSIVTHFLTHVLSFYCPWAMFRKASEEILYWMPRSNCRLN